ncbi:MAG TPA: hypothetical protein VGU22_04845 [Methylomirabilota bacterium]|nr:hypothetical protein [Methylomirabilota bacterium]
MTDRWTVRSLAPVALAIVVMLPRLASPQFGLLDDGLTLQTGHEVIGRWSSVLYLIPETGRFFPAYWLLSSAIVGIVGARPLAFFTVNVLLLAGLLAILARLVRWGRGTALQAAVAAVLFALSGPAVETFYTLSKAEPLQMTWIGLSLLATAASAVEARRARRAALITLAAAAVLLAHATKETSVVLVAISLGWLAIEWWSRREREACARFAATYVAVNLVAAAAFAALRWSYAPLGLAPGWYTRAYSLEVATVGPALFRISSWLIRDFAFLLPLLVVAVLSLVRGRPAGRRPILYACVWMGGWLAVYVPWPATFEYYLLPFAFGAALLAGTVVGDVWGWRGHQHPAAIRRAAWSVLVASGSLWLLAITNAIADARVQLAVDGANTDLVDFLAGLPSRSRVVLNSRENEYLYELPRHLSAIKNRPDLVVEHLPRAARGGPPATPVFITTPEMANQPVPTVRIAPLGSAALAGRGELVYRAARRTDVVEVGLHRLLCRVAASPILDATYCPSDRGMIHRRTFSYGWQVHRHDR